MEHDLKILSLQFAHCFAKKQVVGITELLTDEFSLYDPALKWVRGKQRVVDLLTRQFQETSHVAYDVIHLYQEGETTILEFKIILDHLTLYGVDFMEWKNGKMTELRCYYNPPEK